MTKESRSGAQGSAGTAGATGTQGAAGNAKGVLEATSNTLPTAAVGTADEPAEITALRWTLQPGAGITAGGVASRLHEPRLRSEQAQLGFFFNVEVGGTVINETFAPLRRGNSSLVNPDVIIFFQGDRRVIVRQSLNGDWRFYGVGSTLPANSVIKIYRAIVRGQIGAQGLKGDKGDKGATGPQGPQGAAGNAKGALEATSNTLPTAAVGTVDEPAEITALRWTLQPGAGIGAVRISAARLHEPRLRSEQAQLGFFFDVEVDGAVINETFVPLSRGKTSVYPNPDAVLFFGGNKRVVVRQFLNGAWRFMGVGSTLPANSVIKIYRAIVRGQTGAQGPKGDKGDTGATGPRGPQGGVGNSRGQLEATSSVLPTAAVADNTRITGITWTFEAGASLTLDTGNLDEPYKTAESAQIGWWFIGETNGVEFSQSFVEFGIQSQNEVDINFAREIGVKLKQFQNGDWVLRGKNDVLPANSVVKIYRAIVRGQTGAQGPKGDPGESTVGEANVLKAQSSLPPIASASVGDIVNLNGELQELVANTEGPNVYHGTIASLPAEGTSFIGDDTFKYQTVDPFNVRLRLLKADVTSPPSALYIRVTGSGVYSEIEMGRASGGDTTERYAYNKMPGSSSVDAIPVGDRFKIEVFSDGAFATPFTINAANRWERDDRNNPNINPIALTGNTDRWPASKLPQRNARGALQATSPVLPTAAHAGGRPVVLTAPWTLASGSVMTLLSGQPSDGGGAPVPARLPANPAQFGWWFVSEVNGVEFEALFLPYENMGDNDSHRLNFTSSTRLRVHGGSDNGFTFKGDNDVLPANSRVKIYMAVI